jgi:hypothetical protein
MNPKLVSPWKRPNSSNYWFRLAIPARYRVNVGQIEIKQSLMTANLGEARRLCAQLQSDWLTKFATFDQERENAARANGANIIDQFLEFEASEHGGLDAVVAYGEGFRAHLRTKASHAGTRGPPPHQHVVQHALTQRGDRTVGRQGSHGKFLSVEGTPWSGANRAQPKAYKYSTTPTRATLPRSGFVHGAHSCRAGFYRIWRGSPCPSVNFA